MERKRVAPKAPAGTRRTVASKPGHGAGAGAAAVPKSSAKTAPAKRAGMAASRVGSSTLRTTVVAASRSGATKPSASSARPASSRKPARMPPPDLAKPPTAPSRRAVAAPAKAVALPAPASGLQERKQAGQAKALIWARLSADVAKGQRNKQSRSWLLAGLPLPVLASICSYLTIRERFRDLALVCAAVTPVLRLPLAWADGDCVSCVRGHANVLLRLTRELGLSVPAVVLGHQFMYHRTLPDGIGDMRGSLHTLRSCCGAALRTLHLASDKWMLHWLLRTVDADFPNLRALTLTTIDELDEHDRPSAMSLHRGHVDSLAALPHLQSLRLSCTVPDSREMPGSPHPLVGLARLSRLTRLHVDRSQQGVDELLAACAQRGVPLTDLELGSTMTDKGAAALSGLPALTRLQCVLHRGWSSLSPLPASLRELHLECAREEKNAPAQAVDLAPLRRLPALTELGLTYFDLSAGKDRGRGCSLAPLAQCRALQWLALLGDGPGAAVDAGNFAHVARIPHLDSLSLSLASLTNAAFEALRGVRLWSLEISNCDQLTAECLSVVTGGSLAEAAETSGAASDAAGTAAAAASRSAMPLRHLVVYRLRGLTEQHLAPLARMPTLRWLSAHSDGVVAEWDATALALQRPTFR